jgi:hypothetical protein
MFVATSVGHAQTSPAPYCLPGRAPAFDGALVELNDHLGGLLGDPIECLHPDLVTGDAIQQTSTGLAVIQSGTGFAGFVSGDEHWQLTPGGIAYWTEPVTPVTPVPPTEPQPVMVDAAIAEASNRFSVDPANIQVVRVEHVDWSNSSLGCGRPDSAYLQVITPGWLIELEISGCRFSYHTDEGSRVILCPTFQPRQPPRPILVPPPGFPVQNTLVD